MYCLFRCFHGFVNSDIVDICIVDICIGAGLPYNRSYTIGAGLSSSTLASKILVNSEPHRVTFIYQDWSRNVTGRRPDVVENLTHHFGPCEP